MTANLSNTDLLAGIRAVHCDETPREVLEAARGVFELADTVNRREGNPFADPANLDDEDLTALYERVHARFRAICTVHSGGAQVAP